MFYPDFNNNLLNLTASISLSYGCQTSYQPLLNISADKLSQKENIILMVIDGLGYNFFNKFVSEKILQDNTLGSITSVFPSTTAVAITSILTGKSPKEHALTGWFVYLKELGSASKILPLEPRYSTSTYFDNHADSNIIYDLDSIFDNFNAQAHFVHLNKYKDDYYQKILRGQSIFHGFDQLDQISSSISNILENKVSQRNFIYTYWNGLDAISHQYGYDSEQAIDHFNKIQEEIVNIVNSIDRENTSLIITADHGFINVNNDNKLRVKDIPGLRDCLVLPLMGEPRSPYCYLRSGKEEKFKQIWKQYLSPYSQLFHIDEMIDKQVFGLNKMNNKFTDRVGDYIIVMNDGYVLIDNVLLEKEMDLVGYHGGLSENEMMVPLIYIT